MDKNEYREEVIRNLQNISEALMSLNPVTDVHNHSEKTNSILDDIDTAKIGEAFKLFGGLLKK